MTVEEVRISELPEAAPIQGDELLEMVQDGENVKVRANQLGGNGDTTVESVNGLPEALDAKVNKEEGKGLSEANFTQTEKTKLASVGDTARNFVNDYLTKRG